MKPFAHRTILKWVLAAAITAAAAYYQRVTGPSYPLTGTVPIAGDQIPYRFDRSHGGDDDHLVQVPVGDAEVSGVLLWKRYKTADEWRQVGMIRRGGLLVAALPHQPPAGKLEYRVMLEGSNERVVAPAEQPVVIRFKGDVPLSILIPHVIIIFLAMLFSTRTGLECFSASPNLKKLTMWTLGLLVVGGMILGPIVQRYAFGAFWTGFPFGTDLTDNKVLVALIAWVTATVALFKSKKPARWVLAAAIILLVVYLVPHSLLGSELDYSKYPTQ